MTIKFLYPNPQQKEILDELEKISEVLSKEPSLQLKKNMRFVRKFTYALLKTGKSEPVKKQPVKYIEPEVKEITRIIKPEKKVITPLPPPPPVSVIKQHINSQVYTRLRREGNMLKYESIEPVMENQDWKIFTKVRNEIKRQLITNPSILENENFLTEEIKKASKELKIKFSIDYVKKIKYYLIKNIKGFGKIDPLMKDDKVKSIICNSYDNINVVYDNETLSTNIKFNTNEELDDFILNLTEKFNKRVSEENPSIEFSSDKFKVNLNYNPLMGSSFRLDKL